MLEFERTWWQFDESRDELIRARFGCSSDEYYCRAQPGDSTTRVRWPRPARVRRFQRRRAPARVIERDDAEHRVTREQHGGVAAGNAVRRVTHDPTIPVGRGAERPARRSATRFTGRLADSRSSSPSIAVVVGFLIFRSIDDSDGGGQRHRHGRPRWRPAHDDDRRRRTPDDGRDRRPPPADVTTAATVIVANAGVRRCGRQDDRASSTGRRVHASPQPTDGTGEKLAVTVVYSPSPPQSRRRPVGRPRPRRCRRAADAGADPRHGRQLGTATVLVMLGDDIAGQTLATSPRRVRPNVQAPVPAAGPSLDDGLSRR